MNEETEGPQTWRELLGLILHDPHEQARLAVELGVTSITLTRWAHGESTPRLQNMQALLLALPQHRQALLALLSKEFGSLVKDVKVGEEAVQEIPSAFFTSIIHAHAELPDTLRFWSICDLILLQALQQLDPNRVGMEVTVVQCMPPRDGQYVRSLREICGRGTPPWTRGLQEKNFLLGVESLAGYAVTSGRSVVLQTRHEEQSQFPARWVEHEESAAAHPIFRAGCIAGCLLFSSAQPDYFLPFRLALITSYAELVALAFEREDFYKPDQIKLGIMPTFAEQERYFSNFTRRVSDLVQKATKNQLSVNIVEAQKLVLMQIETEFLSLTPRKKVNTGSRA